MDYNRFKSKLIGYGLTVLSLFGLSNKAEAAPKNNNTASFAVDTVANVKPMAVDTSKTIVLEPSMAVEQRDTISNKIDSIKNSRQTDVIVSDTISLINDSLPVNPNVNTQNLDSLKINGDTLSVQERNLKRAQEAFDDLFVLIAYMENFSRKVYHCGARYTIGYGSTILDNNKRVTRYTRPITEERGKQLVEHHVKEHVYPFIKYINKDLDKHQLVVVCSMIYNAGGEFFSGYDKEGNAVRDKASNFLTSINSGDDDYTCAKHMLEAHVSAGKVAWGLFKGRWVNAAIYTGKLKPQEILNFKPGGLYLVETKDLNKLYDFTPEDKIKISNFRINKDERRSTYMNFNPKLDDSTINWFIEFNQPQEGGKKVSSVIDKETVVRVNIMAEREKNRIHFNKVITRDIQMPPLEVRLEPKDKIEIKTSSTSFVDVKRKRGR